MATRIDWSHLPRETWSKVCFCPGANGYSLDPKTGYFVHSCGKPSVRVAIQKCDVCGKVFVPKYYEKIRDAIYYPVGIACDECLPPKESR